MKFPSAYYLMLIYLTVMFKPIIPVIRDMYAHTFGEAIHLATIHAKYGSNHLDKSVAKDGGQNKDQKTTTSVETSPVHLTLPGYRYNFQIDKLKALYCFSRRYKLSNIFLSIISPPPKH